MKRLSLAIASLVLMTRAAFAEPGSYEFTPFPSARAIAADGTVLTGEAICRRGTCEPIAEGVGGWARDLNASGTVVGYPPFEGGFCPPSRGFIRDRDGTLQTLGVSLYAISDNDTALGFVSFCVVGAYLLLIDGEVQWLPQARPLLSSLHAAPISINDSGTILAALYADWDHPTYILSDEDKLTHLEAPDLPGSIRYLFSDLNNRRQVVGWWEELTHDPDPYAPLLYHGILRDADGAVRPIEWAYEWPESITRRAYNVQSQQWEDVTLPFVRRLGTKLLGINTRGDVVATTLALYRGRISNGQTLSVVDELNGIGSAH